MNLPIAFNEFWRRASEVELSPNQIALYMGLLQLANEKRWESLTLKISNKRIKSMLFIEHDETLIRARKALIGKGFIKFKPGKVNHEYSEYTLIGIEKTTNTTTPLNEVVNSKTTNGTTNMSTNGTTTFSGAVVPIIEEINKKKSSSEVNFKFLK